MILLYLIEKASNKIGCTLAVNLNLDEDNKEVLVYGAFCLLQTILCFSSIILFGYIFNVLIEALLVSISASILRKYSGGVHSASPNRCLIISILISVGFSLIVVSATNYLTSSILILLVFIGILYSYYFVYKYAPVDSEAKPINNINKRKKLKLKSLKCLSIMTILIALLILAYILKLNRNLLIYCECIAVGITWQSFTLTKIGHNFLTNIDNIFIKN